MRVWMIVLLPLLGGISCGGGDSSGTASAGEKACNDLTAKASQCHLIVQCNTAADPCTTNCQAKADCTQLTAPPTGSYLNCMATCLGLTADQVFVCKDGSAILSKDGLCNGRFECPDGSDEKNCGASKDAGKD